MIAVKTGRRRTKGRSRMGSLALSVVGFAMVAIMGLMIASADQSPYGATPVWSAEPTGTYHRAPAGRSRKSVDRIDIPRPGQPKSAGCHADTRRDALGGKSRN